MKQTLLLISIVVLSLNISAQTIYNNGAHIVSTSGSYWVLDNGSFTLTSNSSTNPTQFDELIINDDASLILGSASTPAYLTVDGLSMISPATVTIPSGSTGSSSLIVGTIYGTRSFTVNRYFTGANLAWHLISSPITSQEISGVFTPGGSTYDFYLYNEPTNEWINRKNLDGGGGVAPYFDDVNGDLLFTPGRGYLAAYDESNPTKSFSGAINQGTISQSVTFSGTTGYQGANLLGNPYPSSLDWKAPTGWTRTMLRDDDPGLETGYSMYIWNETANNYGTYISNETDDIGTNSVTRYIPPMQGFFVMAASAGSFQMNEDVCVHESVSSWLKNSSVNPDIIKLKVSNPEFGSDEVLLEDNEINTGGAQKWFSFVETAPSLWIDFEDKQYSILMDDVIEDENHYSIGFKPGMEEQYTLTASFDAGSYVDIMLEDKKLSSFHNLLESPDYHFYGYPSDDPARFALHFSAVGLPETETTSSPIQVYSNGKGINVINNNNLTGEITILNILGQQMDSFKLDSNINQTHHADFPSGVYVVYIKTSAGQVYSEKVIVN
ncbi:MAG: T9SS type A sorting domain-containing protein [Bacteroidetes bacterium]|nr:T9SS type A sorting domain-containing protein [Bacteroidota bacterium]